MNRWLKKVDLFGGRRKGVVGTDPAGRQKIIPQTELSGSNTGDVSINTSIANYLTLLNQVITLQLINLVTHVTGELPPANLEDSGVTPGTYGDSTHVPQVTVDAKGRVTAAVDVAITGTGSWIPLSLGIEPLAFMSDGAGQPMLVWYTP